MSAKEKIAWLKGLLSGLEIEGRDAKIYGAVAEALDALATQIEEQDNEIESLRIMFEELDEDIETLENRLDEEYEDDGEEDDEIIEYSEKFPLDMEFDDENRQ